MFAKTTLAAVVALTLAAGGAHAQSCDGEAQQTAEMAYATAYQFVSAQQWDEAIPSLEQALESCPEHWGSVELLAQARMRNKEYLPAVRLYQRVIDGQYDGQLEMAPDRVLYLYGRAHLSLKNWKQAEEVFNAMLTVDPADTRALSMLSHIYEQTGETQKAIGVNETLFEVAGSEDERADAARALGDLYKDQGMPEKAAEWYGKGGGKSSSGMFALGAEAMKSKKWAEAAASFEQYLESNPKSAAAWRNLGVCYQKLGNLQQAVTAYERCLEIDETRHDVMSSLGFLYMDLGQVSKAGKLAQEALAAWEAENSKRADMVFLMGQVLEVRDNNYEAAMQRFQQLTSHPFWGERAKREITRQQQLIDRREAQARQGGR